MSHAHGWASGPAAALSFHVLGLRTLGSGSNHSFIVAPTVPAGMQWCNGSLAMGDGFVEVQWTLPLPTADSKTESKNKRLFELEVDASLHAGHGTNDPCS